jgi:RNA polymerase sigma-70 factor, ECF subfamily
MSTPDRAIEADFRRWYERTSVRLYGYVRRHCPADECDDVMAEVYLAAWRRFGDLPADAVPWLIGTARKVLSNHWRSKGRRERLATEASALSDLTSPDCATHAVERTDLVSALSALSPEDREVLLLAGWDGLDTQGLATALACSPVAARARLSRARRRFSAQLNVEFQAAVPTLYLVEEVN